MDEGALSERRLDWAGILTPSFTWVSPLASGDARSCSSSALSLLFSTRHPTALVTACPPSPFRLPGFRYTFLETKLQFICTVKLTMTVLGQHYLHRL